MARPKGIKNRPKVSIICKECGKTFLVPFFKSKRRKFCDYICANTWNSKHPSQNFKNPTREERAKKALREKFKSGEITIWNKGKILEDELGEEKYVEYIKKQRETRVGKIREGFTVSEELRREISKKHKGNNNISKHYDEILRQTKYLEEEGFRCIPIGKVIPDIVAIKDGKVFAIEVAKRAPNWEKYSDDVRKYFDDIIWILIKKDKRVLRRG